jgi:hypothetical protein
MFDHFDPKLFDDPHFKEDSVREVILTPLLTRLGYHVTGAARVIRSKTLIHPFIYVGTRKHPVTVIPDYTLLYESQPILVLDAKSPLEDILRKEHVQQAYSYAIHPEIRCAHFALCNGRSLAVFAVDRPTPLAIVPFDRFESDWPGIEKLLAPRFLLEPILRRFVPDFGSCLMRMGLTSDTDIIIPGVRLGLFARISDTLLTASSNCELGDNIYCASYDFAPDLLGPIIAGLPPPLRTAFEAALRHAPFQAHADLVIDVDLKMRLGVETKSLDETFVPLLITEVLESRFNPDPLPDYPTDVPPEVFRLRNAFRIQGGGNDA